MEWLPGMLMHLKKNMTSLLAFFSALANTYINIKPSIRSKKKNQQLKGCNFNIYMNWDNLCFNRKLAYPFYLTLQLQIYFQLSISTTKLLIRFNVSNKSNKRKKTLERKYRLWVESFTFVSRSIKMLVLIALPNSLTPNLYHMVYLSS